VREPEGRELKEGEIDEEAALLSFSQLVSTRTMRIHLSRSHERWMGPVQQRNRSLDGAMRQPVKRVSWMVNTIEGGEIFIFSLREGGHAHKINQIGACGD
jgi:hypothetical protein